MNRKSPAGKARPTSARTGGRRPEEPKKQKKAVPEEGGGRIRRQFLKTKDCYRVTFRLPAEAVRDAENVTLVGDFNSWDPGATPLKRLKSGDFTTSVELPPGREYRFRYLVDGSRWENDWCADKYAPNDFGADDSVVVL